MSTSDYIRFYADEMQRMSEELVSLSVNVANLEKDAERYRWLKERMCIMEVGTHDGVQHEIVLDEIKVDDVETVTEAIDRMIEDGVDVQ